MFCNKEQVLCKAPLGSSVCKLSKFVKKKATDFDRRNCFSPLEFVKNSGMNLQIKGDYQIELYHIKSWLLRWFWLSSQLTFTCSKSTKETVAKGVKYVKS